MKENINIDIQEYINKLFAPEDDVLRWVREKCANEGLSAINLQPHEARLLQILLKLLGAKRVLEIGTLGGYSGIWLARALEDNGKLYTLEIDPKHAAVAKASFTRAEIGDRVELMLGDAKDSLARLENAEQFDLVFIDADKEQYPYYLDWAIKNVRVGGVICAHNVTHLGETARPMTEFNRLLADDERLDSHVLALGQGMAVAIRR